MRFAEDVQKPALIVHADDFGISLLQSELILSCCSAAGGSGALNSLSVLVNSPRFHECAVLLDPYVCTNSAMSDPPMSPEQRQPLHVGLHLNLVEGRCVADPSSIPLLATSDGMFKRSFADLLRISVAEPTECRRQVAIEAHAQINCMLERFPVLHDRMRIDSHQHFHLIPAVFDGLIDAIERVDCRIEYLRIPAEPTGPFVKGTRPLSAVPAINWVKHALLNTLWMRSRGKIAGIEQISGVFCGINYSGRMTSHNVSLVFPEFQRLAHAQQRSLELLFHPGGLADASACLNPALTGFVDFYRSPNRDAERRAVQELKDLMR